MENKKKILIICLIVIIIASIITNIYVLSNRNKENTYNNESINTVKNKEILNDTTVEGLKITNISLLTVEDSSTYKATVTNNTNEEINIGKLYVVFSENTKENKIIALMDTILQPNDSTNITLISESNLSNTTNIKYVIESINAE